MRPPSCQPEDVNERLWERPREVGSPGRDLGSHRGGPRLRFGLWEKGTDRSRRTLQGFVAAVAPDGGYQVGIKIGADQRFWAVDDVD